MHYIKLQLSGYGCTLRECERCMLTLSVIISNHQCRRKPKQVCKEVGLQVCMCVWLVAWNSVRTSAVFRPANFPVLRLTCSCWVTTYVGKPSATG